MHPWTERQIPSQAHKLVLVTGATSGIGYSTALELARHGAELILPARNEQNATEAATRIRSAVPGARLHTDLLNLSDLDSVRSFVDQFQHRFSGRSLDLLINNAGIMGLPRRELTPQGMERQFATNYLGPFLLTALLFPRMRSQAESRIVCVSSTVARSATIQLDDLQSERKYLPVGAYAQSKLALLMFALTMQRRLLKAKSPIMSVAAHPGWAATKITRSAGRIQKAMAALSRGVLQSPAQGAAPILLAATDPNVQPGGYYGPGGWKEIRGNPAAVEIPSSAQDEALGEQLWDETERILGVRFL